MLEGLKKLLFPRRCAFCRRLIEEDGGYLCSECADKVKEISRPKAHKGSFYNEALAVYSYKDQVRQAIHRYKFHGGVYLGEFFGSKMAEKVRQAGWQIDIVTSAPSHPSKRRKKGYDHAYLLARETAKELDAPCLQLLSKTRRTPPMYGLTPAQRRANIMGSIKLSCPAEQIKGKRILLADDIITTGSTASECARVLKTAGAAYVAVICAAGAKR